MSMEASQPPADMPPPQQSFSDVWIKALTQPSVATYEDFVARPGVSLGRAFAWVFVCSFAASIFTFLGVIFTRSVSSLSLGQSPELARAATSPFYLFVCGVPISAAFSIVGLVIVTGISHLVARLLGGTGTFTQLTYAVAAYVAPMSVVGSLLGLIPFVGCLNGLLAIYGVFLNVVAIKAVHRFDWGRAVVSSLALFVVIIAFAACVVAVVLAVLAPAVGTVFSNIIQQMGTPMP
jgi:hypothetical protein